MVRCGFRVESKQRDPEPKGSRVFNHSILHAMPKHPFNDDLTSVEKKFAQDTNDLFAAVILFITLGILVAYAFGLI